MSRKNPQRYNRRVSEDVASLDSWSEITDEITDVSTRNDRRASRVDTPVVVKEKKNSSNQLLLNPSNLLSKSAVRNPTSSKDKGQELREKSHHTGLPADHPPVSGKSASGTLVGVQFDINTSDPFDIDDGSFDHISNVYLSLPEDHTSYLRESYSTVSALENNLEYDDRSDFHSLPDLTAVTSKTRTYPPHYVHPKVYSEHGETSEKVKNKLMSMWNNVKYGWTLKTKTTFRFDSPVWLLGKFYHIKPSDLLDDDNQRGKRTRMVPNLERFKQDFSSLLWFTYRQDFHPIPGTKLTSDCGWGCMLRSGQMMLAKAFIIHYLGRDWNVFSDQTREQETYRKQIIRWFGDYLCDESPFSMHRLVEVGKTLGKQPGEWFGPASVAHILKETMIKGQRTQTVLNDLCIYVSQDCTVYKQDVYDLCCTRSRTATKFTSSSESESESNPGTSDLEWKRAVIILIPVRLGGEQLNPVYIPCVKGLLSQDSCIGIIGGKPKHSLYFVGWQENKLIYLDPHYCQDVVDTRERQFPIQSYHCMSPRKVSIEKIDPSCTIGFYCRDQKEFEKFVQQTEEMVAPPKQRLSYPMFVFSEGHSYDVQVDTAENDRLLRVKHVHMDQNGRVRSQTLDSEEFVVKMVRITEDLVRKRAEHNNLEISTLEEVSLHQQDIEKIENLDKWCRDLKILYLQSNLIPKIENVSRLKKLEYLNLALNNVEKIENLENCEMLKKLDLTVNFVGELTSIENLKDLVHFKELYLTGNPCTEYEGYREYVIATLPRLQHLDGKAVEKSERIKAMQNVGLLRGYIVEQQNRHKKKRLKEKEEMKRHEESKQKPKLELNVTKEQFPKAHWYTNIEGDQKTSEEVGNDTKSGSHDESEEEDEEALAEKDKKFWEEEVPFTPESRVAVHEHMKKLKQKEDQKNKAPPKQPRRLFAEDGRPLNVNEAKIDFTLTEDDSENNILLDVACFKHMDTSLIDCDVQPNYVRVTLKGKVNSVAFI
ncbi:uncharacterized protein LOC134238646 [Saccostrea cucullata]|uniref:uncharacterized protein LOC134238646 n=1 Tax=Saccostrea cuccullata TaxID=36930 RepID=UPI002ED14515